MESYLIYIGKVAIAAGAFYIAFLLLFQNQKHFTFNRLYLPVSLALSFIIPLITFTTVKYIEPANFDVNSFAYLAPASGEIIQPAFVFEWYHYLFGLYILGVAGFLFHLLLGHLKAINIIKKSRIQKIFDNLVNITKKDVHPFSFFSKIVVSEKTLSHPDLEMIVSHENIHVREKHTLDILFVEIMFLFQWFNPFAWLIKDAVKNNLEYKTDNEIAKHYNPQTYQLAMVTLADKQGIAPFLTALNGSQLKNRIVMMKKKTESKYAFVKQLVVLPLLAVLVMGLSNKEVKTEVKQNVEIHSAKTDLLSTVDSVKDVIIGKVSNEKGEPLKGAKVEMKGKATKTLTDSLGSYKIVGEYGDKLVFSYPGKLNKTVKVDKNLMDVQLKTDGTVVTEEGNSENQQMKGSGYTISGGLKETVQKGSENVTITPSTQNGITIRSAGNQTGQPLYLVDGVETTSTFLNEISPDSIESISVLKDKSATIVYGEKGKNGVVLITTKQSFEKVADKVAGNPIVIVDGQEYKSMEEVNIPPEEIASISILKNETASPKIYGERAKDGVIVINTKTKYNSDKADPLILVNGKETGQKVNDIDPETIQSVNVLKDESATKKYGEKGKNGVIEITLKPEIITTDLELRQFIAAKIKYPVEAQENGIVGKIGLAATFDKNGKVISIEDSNQKYQNLDEIVVTSINQGKIQLVQDNNSEILKKEVRRLINLLPPVEMTDFKEKTINIIVEFKLQD